MDERIKKFIEENPTLFVQTFAKSKTYDRILDHRGSCPLWRKGFCLDCFGGGLNKTIQMWENEAFTK